MVRNKCNFCGFVGFPDDSICKKCKQDMNGEVREAVCPANEPQTLGALKFKSKISLLAIIVLIVGGGLTFLSIGLLIFYGNSFYIEDLKYIFLMGAVVPFLACVGVFIKLSERKVRVYQNGFICRNGKKEATVFWREIIDVHEELEWLWVGLVPIGYDRKITLKTCFDEDYILAQELGGFSKMQDYIMENARRYV